jgi:O-antigen biosynthesis protein
MDELRFPVNFNDVDYCLKLRALGKRIVFTLMQSWRIRTRLLAEAISILRDKRAMKGSSRTYGQNGGQVLARDPYYSPLLSLDAIPFSALAWPPRTVEPRINCPLVATFVPPGF